MVNKSLAIRWDKSAYNSLQRIYEYIDQDSPANANKVREGILELINSLATHPEKYPFDKYKKNNPGSYRAFEKFSYRIAYKYTEKEILILRVRHVKQEPKKY